MRTELLTIVVLALLYSCQSHEGNDVKSESSAINESFTNTLKTESVKVGKIKKNISFTGSVVCNPEKSISYIPNYSGSIVKSHIKPGEKVRKGQKLLEIRSSELNSKQSELLSLKEDITLLRRELKSAEHLYTDNFLSERDLLEVRSRVRVAENRYEKCLSDISIYGNLTDSGLIEINAPVDGYVISKNGSAGSTVTPESEPLFVISDLSDVWIMVNVFASDLMFVKPDMDAEITTISYKGEKFAGRVDNISQVFDDEDRTLKARIVLSNEEMKLKPGMQVSVNLLNEYEKELVSVPASSVIFDDNKYYVVTGIGNDLAIREITIEEQNDGVSYVSHGLKQHELVVTANHLLVYNHLKSR